MVSQRKVQEFLKFYQSEHKITVLLTSHYMKDVEALCSRAIVINQGVIKHDGPLAEIVERFSKEKVIQLQIAGEIPRIWRSTGLCWKRRPADSPQSRTHPRPRHTERPAGTLPSRGHQRPGPSARRGDRGVLYRYDDCLTVLESVTLLSQVTDTGVNRSAAGR